MSLVALQAQTCSHGKRSGRGARVVRGGVDVAVGRAYGHAERVTDLVGSVHLLVSHQAGKNGQTGGIGRGPGVGAAIIAVHVVVRTRSCLPVRPVEPDVVELVEAVVRLVDDENVAVPCAALVDVAGLAAFDPSGQGDGLVRNRVERKRLLGRVVDAVGLVRPDERRSLLRLRPSNDDHRETVDVTTSRIAAEIGMQPPG